jgi:hypothetical protein
MSIGMKESKGKGKTRSNTVKSKKKDAKAIKNSEPGRSENKRRRRSCASEKVEDKSEPESKEPGDFGEARKMMATLVRLSSRKIVLACIDAASAGQLAPAKYLFEAVGMYPPTPDTVSKPEDSPAYTLLKRMLLSSDPANGEEVPTLPVPLKGEAEAAGVGDWGSGLRHGGNETDASAKSR